LTGNSNAGGGYVIQKAYNLGTAVNAGIDLQLGYHFDLPPGFGGMSLTMNGSYLLENTAQPIPGAHTYDCAGLFGVTCQTVNPHWHHIFRTTWDTPWNVSGSLTWRYIGSSSQDNNTNDETLHYATWGAYDFYNAKIPAYNYIDLEATWNVNKVLQLRAGANNVLDKDPPLIDSVLVSGGAANTYSVYDIFGRTLFLAFTAKF
jgi:outer membrane receptor protein involved in Fe transport